MPRTLVLVALVASAGCSSKPPAALGFPTLTAATQSSAGVDGLWKYDLTKYGLDPTVDEPHYLFGYIPQARAQAGEYLNSFDTDVLAE